MDRQWRPSAYRQAMVARDGTIVPVSEFFTLLHSTVATVHREEQTDNIILFIHGRGKHPGKAFRQKLLERLEADYSAKVLMFHWPSWEGALGFPETNARAAAKDLGLVLRQLEDFQQTHQDDIQDIRFTLLTQSMGSLVLEECVKTWENQTLPPLFDTVVISAPASATQDHATWLNQLTLAPHVYVTSHQHDPVLASAILRTHQPRLGQHLPQDPNAFAARAVYLDISSAWVVHRYYLHRYLKYTPHLRDFFDKTLNGLPADLTAAKGFTHTPNPQVYKLGNVK